MRISIGIGHWKDDVILISTCVVFPILVTECYFTIWFVDEISRSRVNFYSQWQKFIYPIFTIVFVGDGLDTIK